VEDVRRELERRRQEGINAAQRKKAAKDRWVIFLDDVTVQTEGRGFLVQV
jgi:hypothetical protein